MIGPNVKYSYNFYQQMDIFPPILSSITFKGSLFFFWGGEFFSVRNDKHRLILRNSITLANFVN